MGTTLRPSIGTQQCAGILTCSPSGPPFGIPLGPTNPSLITIAKETLVFRRTGVSPVLRLLVPAFSLLYAPPSLTRWLHRKQNALLPLVHFIENPKYILENKDFGNRKRRAPCCLRDGTSSSLDVLRSERPQRPSLNRSRCWRRPKAAAAPSRVGYYAIFNRQLPLSRLPRSSEGRSPLNPRASWSTGRPSRAGSHNYSL